MNNETDTNADKSLSGSGRRLLAVLSYLADHPRISVRSAAREMGLPASAVHRQLRLLAEAGYASVDSLDSAYLAGSELYRLSARVLSEVNPINLAEKIVDEAARVYNETVLLGLYHRGKQALSFAVRKNGEQKLMYHIEMNEPLSLAWGASGKSILAYLDEKAVAEVYNKNEHSPVSGATLPSIKNLSEELTVIRQQGYSISYGEKLPGACGIAAPVFNHEGIYGCLCLTSPQERLPKAKAALAKIALGIATYASELSQQLGAKK